MVSNKCHKRERQVNESHASGSDNFNSAEEVHVNIHVCVCAVRATVKVTCHAIYLSILIINLIKCRYSVAPHLLAYASKTAEQLFLLIVTTDAQQCCMRTSKTISLRSGQTKKAFQSSASEATRNTVTPPAWVPAEGLD